MAGAEVRRTAPSPTEAGRTAGAVAAATAAAPEGGPAADGEAAEEEAKAEAREEDAADLPIGMDLDGDEPWEPAFEGPAPGLPDPPDPGGPPGSGRHVEVGELDEVELHVDPAPGPRPDVSIGLVEDDDPPEGGPAPGRSGRGPGE